VKHSASWAKKIGKICTRLPRTPASDEICQDIENYKKIFCFFTAKYLAPSPNGNWLYRPKGGDIQIRRKIPFIRVVTQICLLLPFGSSAGGM
jgi:hypothetical protein